MIAAAPALATPVATDDESYDALGRVFPDPLAGCEPGAGVCSPNAQGNVPATQFIQFTEFLDGIEYMNSNPAWQPYLEVQVLDGQVGANGGGEGPADPDLGIGSPGEAVFPGNNLPLEYDPKPEYRSAGLPRPDLSREKSDLIVLRVTDETVPDAGKKRYALSLSIHGIERAGVEGGTRAMEDLVTTYTTDRSDVPIVPPTVDPNAPTFAEALRESIIYFTYPNPDGWRRGSIGDDELGPGVFFQRYNGNGVDLNRDWPDIGFSFRPYSGLSEPESRGLAGYLGDIEAATGDDFAAGDDLHGQPFADALSYTLLPHGSHDFAKDQRIRDSAVAIHRASEAALLWSPAIQENAADPPDCVPSAPVVGTPVGDPCFPIYGQTWGTVYDTINYTTTGALGDYFDSSVGLGADGIDNEMSFSHLDKNVNFDPHTEQLHVDGNKALIYAHISELVDEQEYEFDPAGTQGYVPNLRLTREAQATQPPPPQGTEPQTDITGQLGEPAADTPGSTEFKFVVKSGPQSDASSPDDGKDIFNGGLRVEITKGNLQGIGDGGVTSLQVQCRGCDRHVGVEDDDEWVTVTDDYNQSPVYLQSGLTAAVNFPDSRKPDGTLVEWRALLTGVQAAEMNVDFTHGPATTSGATGGDPAPVLAAYDVANTDFFEDLNDFVEDPAEEFQAIDPRAVIDGTRSLSGLRSLVLADDALPGYTGAYEGEAAPPTPPTGPPTADQSFRMQQSTVPGQGPESCERTAATAERYQFTIGADDGNESLRGTVTWGDPAHDYDVFLLQLEGSEATVVDESVDFNLLTGNAREVVEMQRPPAGDYAIEVVNCTTAPTSDADPWEGTLEFEPAVQPPASIYTEADKDVWFDALREYVEGGGNLVLTDGAMRGLRELTEIPTNAISEQLVYVGQMTFATGEGEDEATLGHSLAANVDQEGARFNSGMRRQTFEPTPLGYSIQDGNADQSNAHQWQVDLSEWKAAGGSTAATSADDGERNAAPVYDQVTLGELPMGSGQIRIAGALLPQPTQRFDHEFGLEPYAVTYTGYIVACNLLDCTVNQTPAGSGTGGGGDGGDGDGGGGGGGGGGDAPPTGGPTRACQGEPVTMRGTSRADRLRGTKGDDVIRARGGNDRISGGRGDDLICAGSGNDVARGGPGTDSIKGGPGRDRCKGGERDKLRSCDRGARR